MREFRETVDPDALEKLLDALKIELVLLIPPSLEYNDGIWKLCQIYLLIFLLFSCDTRM